MTIAYWCILIAGLMPFAWTSVAKFSQGRFGLEENLTPREFKADLEGPQKRAVWAEQNAFEAFPLFAAAVLVAHAAGAPQGIVDAVAAVFVALRLLHGVLYVTDRGLMRSLVWFSALACCVALFVLGAW